ncbi:MAG: ABC transporter ATP-binding protein [Lachnospiraceae bacterium]|nr:ABC transporter ATP-binding protein [Lachnospiraceae bacterium]
MTQSDESIILTKGLTKRYKDTIAVDNLNLKIKKGEVFGLLGPNGAGKTTTTLMLLGLTEPDAGQAFINKIDCTKNSLEVKKQVGYLPDNVGFYPDMTGRENLRFIGKLNGLDGSSLEEQIDRLLNRVGMAKAADKKTQTYSRGMRQRLGIADVLMKNPQVIIMDEPTLGIDPEGIRELMALIRELAEKDGRTLLISSHQLYQIQKVCDRMGIFVKGKLVAHGTLEELGQQINNGGVNTIELSVYPENVKLKNLLDNMEGILELQKQNEYYVIRSGYDIRRKLSKLLMENGYTIMLLRPAGSDLDEIYRQYFEKAGETDAGSKRKKISRA